MGERENGGTEPRLSVPEFVEYCRTRAGLLSGSVETMHAEADDLLNEVDEGVAEIRERLDERSNSENVPAADRNDAGTDVDAIEELETDLEEKQALVEAKRARIDAFQELAAGYADLAEELRSDVEDGRTAMERVVEFEAERDAPAYFEERLTVLEAASRDED